MTTVNFKGIFNAKSARALFNKELAKEVILNLIMSKITLAASSGFTSTIVPSDSINFRKTDGKGNPSEVISLVKAELERLGYKVYLRKNGYTENDDLDLIIHWDEESTS